MTTTLATTAAAPASGASRGTVVFASMEFHPTKANAGGAGMFMHRTVRMLVEQGYTAILLFDAQRHEYERLLNVDRLGIPLGHRFLVYLVEELCEDLVLPIRCADIAIEKSLRLDHAMRKLTAMHTIDLIEIYDYCGHAFHYLSHPAEERPPAAVRLHSTIELMERVTRAPLHPSRVYVYAMERAQLTLADAVLLPGRAFYEKQARPLYPTLTPDRVLISAPVHLPIGEVDYDVDARNVVFYGRLSTMKGFDTFLRAGLLALQDAVFAGWLGQFVLIGPDDVVATALSTEELRASIPPDKISRFRFTGLLDHPRLLGHLGSVAFACFANRMETFCYAAHELHTAGIPLIVNRIPAFEDGFEEGVSAIFFDGTALDLAEQMKRLAHDAELRSRLSRHGKQRAPSYWVDRYTGHLSLLHERREAAGSAAPVEGSAIILSNGDRDAVGQTLSSLAALPLRLFVLELDPAGELRFAGSRWCGSGADGAAAPVGLEEIGDACLFVRAGDVIEAEWAREALRSLAQNPRIGAVGGWMRQHSGVESMAYLYIPEVADGVEPGLRVLLRVGTPQTLAEYLNGWSNQSERSYLLANRAAGLVSVELPRLAVDTRRAVDLPAIPEEAIAGDFDRFSREFLTLARLSGAGQPSGGAAGSALTFDLPDTDADVLATTAIPSLVVLRAAAGSQGELCVLNVLRGDHLSDLAQSAVTRSGVWREAGDAPDAAADARATHSGSMRFHAFGRTGVDLLFGPDRGVCEIVLRGQVYVIDLAAAEKRSVRVWLDELDARPRLQPASSALPHVPTAALTPAHAALQARHPELIAVAETTTAGIASMLRFRSGCFVLTPDELGLPAAATSTRGVAYAAAAIAHAAPRKVAIDIAAAAGAALAERLLSDHRDLQIVALLQETPPAGVRGALDAYLGLGPWLRLAMRFPTRLSAAGVGEGVVGLFSRSGVRTFTVPVRLPALGQASHAAGTPLEVIILGGHGTFEKKPNADRAGAANARGTPLVEDGAEPADDNAGESEPAQSNIIHMIAGVAFACSSGLEIGRLWLPVDDRLAASMARRLPALPQLEFYQDVSDAGGNDSARRLALCIYLDDNELPEAAATALRCGALPILGPASVFAHSPSLRGALSVTYWENAVAIADAMRRAAEGFETLVADYERFRFDREAVTEAGLRALLDELPQQIEPALAVAD